MTPRERGEAILAAMPPYTWTRPLLPIFEAAIIADRRELVNEVREILYDEGWLGRSEQRISALVDPPLEGVPVASNGDK